MEIVCAPETYRRFESSSLRHETAPIFGCVFLWRREEIEGGFVFSEVRASDAVLTSLIKPQSCHSGATLCCQRQQISSSPSVSLYNKEEWLLPFLFTKKMQFYFSAVSSTISASTALTDTLLMPFITPLFDL